MNITEISPGWRACPRPPVSRYFNGGYLSAEKRAAIAAVVEQTGYLPSQQARTLRTRRTRQVGVVMPRLSSESTAPRGGRHQPGAGGQGLPAAAGQHRQRPRPRGGIPGHLPPQRGGRGAVSGQHFYPGAPGGLAEHAPAGGHHRPKVRGVQLRLPRRLRRGAGGHRAAACAGAASGRCTSASPRGTTPPAMPATRALPGRAESGGQAAPCGGYVPGPIHDGSPATGRPAQCWTPAAARTASSALPTPSPWGPCRPAARPA